MKYPVSTALVTEARMYALESLTAHIDYEGWKDGRFKSGRIFTGKFAQIWLAEFCKLNGIPHVKDRSSPYVADDCDLKINGWAVDSKVTTKSGIGGQVTSNHDSKKSIIDLYVFFRTERTVSFIEPLGFVWSRDLVSVATKVSQGEAIPGTNLIQSFSYSYFVDSADMLNFYETLEWLQENQKRAQYDEQVMAGPDDEFPF